MANTVFILKQVRKHLVDTQDIAVAVRVINDYIERLEEGIGKKQ